MIKSGIDLFNKEVAEATEKTKNNLKEVEKEMIDIKNDIRFESSVRKFFFWFTPIMVFIQAFLTIILLFK